MALLAVLASRTMEAMKREMVPADLCPDYGMKSHIRSGASE